jgi:hypothetical protein
MGEIISQDVSGRLKRSLGHYTDLTSLTSQLADNTKKLDDVGLNVKKFGASGSSQSTTGNIISGSKTLTVANIIDFQVGHGIRVNGSQSVLTFKVTAGATSTGTISFALNNWIYMRDISVSAGDSITTVASKIASTYQEGYTANVSGDTVTFTSTGNFPSNNNYFAANTVGVTGVLTLVTQGVNNFISSITSINGTTITLADNASFSASSRSVYHDDTVAIQNTINAASGKAKVYVPDGLYYTSAYLNALSNMKISLAKNATIKLAEGTIDCILRASNISNLIVEGGTWDGSGHYSTRAGGTTKCKGFLFESVTDFVVQDLTIKETREWGIGHFGSKDFVFRNINFDQLDLKSRNNDGITGASLTRGLYENIGGFTTDDMIAIAAGTTEYPDDSIYQTDSTDIVIRKVRPRKKNDSSTYNTWRGVALYAVKDKTLSNVYVDDVKGILEGNPILLNNYWLATDGKKGYMKNIHLNNIQGNQVSTFINGSILVQNIEQIDTLTITNSTRRESLVNAPQVLVARTKVKKLVLDNVSVMWENGKTYPLLYDVGSIDAVSLNNVSAIDTVNNTRMVIYNKNSTDTTTVTKLTATNIHAGGTSGENVQVFGGKVAFNSRELVVNNYRSTPNQWDIINDPTGGIQQYDGTNWLSVGNPRGYTTTSSGSLTTPWTKIASVKLTAQNQRSLTNMSIIGGNNGDTNLYAQFAQVYFRVQQQNAMGSTPNIEVVVSANERMTSSDVVAILTQNDTTATIVDLYVRIIGGFETLHILPNHLGGTSTATFFTNAGVSTTLPLGTQTTARKLYVNVSSDASTSVPNRTIFEESGVLKYKDGSGVVKTVTLT